MNRERYIYTKRANMMRKYGWGYIEKKQVGIIILLTRTLSNRKKRTTSE